LMQFIHKSDNFVMGVKTRATGDLKL